MSYTLTRRGFLAALGVAAGAVVLNGLPLGEATDLELSERLVPGDIFTVEGVFAVNPVTGQSIGRPQYFMVTAVTADGRVKMVPKRPELEVMWRTPGSDRTVHPVGA